MPGAQPAHAWKGREIAGISGYAPPSRIASVEPMMRDDYPKFKGVTDASPHHSVQNDG